MQIRIVFVTTVRMDIATHLGEFLKATDYLRYLDKLCEGFFFTREGTGNDSFCRPVRKT